MYSAAVVVGVDDYEERPLSSAVNDAIKFRDTITALGIVGVEDIRLFTAPERGDSVLATKKNIKDCLWRFYSGTERADRLFFYFAGHGMTVYDDPARSLTRTVIVPCDVRNLERDGDSLIGVDELVDRFNRTGPSEQYYFIDACRDLPYERHPDPGSLGWAAPDLSSARAQAVLYAVSPLGQAIAEQGGLGVFTSHLIDALHGRGVALDYVVARDEYSVTMHSVREYVKAKIEEQVSSQPFWTRKYMLPQLAAHDPSVSAIRRIDHVEPVKLTVHIDPDAAAAGTQVHIYKSRSELAGHGWPPLENHASVLLEPQVHKLEVASEVGTPDRTSILVDLRVTPEVTVQVVTGDRRVANASSSGAVAPTIESRRPSESEDREAQTAAPTPERAQWNLSLARIQRESRTAGDLVTLFAFLAPDDIPLSHLVEHRGILPEPLKSMMNDATATQAALGTLRTYLVARSAGDAAFVHRRVQSHVLAGLNDADRRRWATTSVELLDAAFPREGEDVVFWATCSRLLPHALGAAGHSEAQGVAPAASGRLLSSIALFLNARAQFMEAKSAIDRALALDERALGSGHPAVARDRNYRGRILRLLGDREGAQKEYERAIAIDERVHGPNHPTVATHLVGLGRVLLESGDYVSAKKIHERALAIDEAFAPPDDAHIARDLVMLGRVFTALGELDRAIDLYERGIVKDRAVHGELHPEVATDLVDLGVALAGRKNYAAARRNLEAARAIDEQAYAPNHPSIARDLAELGRVLRLQGESEEARTLIERALEIDERAYPTDHPTLARDERYLLELAQGAGDR